MYAFGNFRFYSLILNLQQSYEGGKKAYFTLHPKLHKEHKNIWQHYQRFELDEVTKFNLGKR